MEKVYLTTEYFSKFTFLLQGEAVASSEIRKYFAEIFAAKGIPGESYTDNDQLFASTDFA